MPPRQAVLHLHVYDSPLHFLLTRKDAKTEALRRRGSGRSSSTLEDTCTEYALGYADDVFRLDLLPKNAAIFDSVPTIVLYAHSLATLRHTTTHTCCLEPAARRTNTTTLLHSSQPAGEPLSRDLSLSPHPSADARTAALNKFIVPQFYR